MHEHIYKYGETANHIYIVYSGEVELFRMSDNKVIHIAMLSKNEIFG